MKCRMVLEFNIPRRMLHQVDSRCDADWFVRKLVQEHIMDDEDQCPLTMNITYGGEEIERQTSQETKTTT